MLTVTMDIIVNIMQHAKLRVMLSHIVHYILHTNVCVSWTIVDDDYDEEAQVTARGTALLADNDDDLNSIETNASGQYGVIEAGGDVKGPVLRVDEAYQRYRKQQRRNPDLPRKTRRDIQHDMETMKPIMPHELGNLLVCWLLEPLFRIARSWPATGRVLMLEQYHAAALVWLSAFP
ncbi:unnamed protein product [Phytophthora fragariaefolia]|uniref:Unnamed protein product n=1 Tax=Phytophthora fragariaefolia TaxID=1490495 RepID=A0A9W7CJA8_9STRA|nr:unnamed protein product [Phytophthora fragariaefolia]